MSQTIVIDGVFFQINQWSGIAKYWKILLQQLDEHLTTLLDTQKPIIYVLARGDSDWLRNQDFKNIKIIPYQFFEPIAALSDYAETGELCKKLDATCFISSYYTLAYGVKNIGFAYDFIPEHLGAMNSIGWKLKELYMSSINECFTISESTSRDASIFYPNICKRSETIIYPPMVKEEFGAATQQDQRILRKKLNLKYPYLVIPGHRGGYKNVQLLNHALIEKGPETAKLCLGVIVTSGEELSDYDCQLYDTHFTFGIRRFHLDHEDMRPLLSGAELLFYPSTLEGFGYPIVEALAAQCPVITTGSTSIPEITKHASPGEFKIISGYNPAEALNTIVKMMHARPKVSLKTVQSLKQAFCTSAGSKLLTMIAQLSQQVSVPSDSYLSPCLSLDGLIA
ncbi:MULTISPECIES: glycosyltransferase [Prochlorococcus]|uniref:glycosyltransferase n=2 Tax=Prochlorococcaceae TaxID=2881426 RepID=UPI0007B32AEB|nr:MULTISPECIES: glycosyltransferase [Prochlorococcus]KZR66155.1 Glycosyl transferases group 1 [Prochlorococcus marinus str. MIT 1312]NMP05463.1 glycosyltransferase family 4 protein [Prochlorococcus sp. P1361]NMP13041.1 glycosyltransferase family 4 protein [Prochlorococcus sp.P1363]